MSYPFRRVIEMVVFRHFGDVYWRSLKKSREAVHGRVWNPIPEALKRVRTHTVQYHLWWDHLPEAAVAATATHRAYWLQYSDSIDKISGGTAWSIVFLFVAALNLLWWLTRPYRQVIMFPASGLAAMTVWFAYGYFMWLEFGWHAVGGHSLDFALLSMLIAWSWGRTEFDRKDL